MVIVDHHTVLKTELCTVAGELRLWGDMRKNGKDKFVWEPEDCETVGQYTNSNERNDARARTEAGLWCRRPSDGWLPFFTVAVCEPGKGC